MLQPPTLYETVPKGWLSCPHEENIDKTPGSLQFASWILPLFQVFQYVSLFHLGIQSTCLVSFYIDVFDQ